MADDDAGDDSQGLPPSALASAIVDQAVDALESAAAASSSGFSNSASSPNPQFFALLAALRNERAAPDILPHETAMVDELSYQLAQQKGALDQASKLDLAKNAAVADLYEADLSRVRYFLATYLRARLTKIHRWALHIDSSDDILSRLSEAEQKFHRTLVTARAACLQETFLQQMPDSLDNLDVEAARLQEGPRTGVFVYASIEEDLGIIPGGPDQPLKAGEKVAILYRTIAPYLATKQVVLK